MRYVIAVLGFVAFVLVPAPRHANAEIVTWEFTGEVDGIHDNANLIGGTIVVGSPIHGVFSFDTTVPDTHPDTTIGFYFDAVTSLAGSVGDEPFGGPVDDPLINMITVGNDSGGVDGLRVDLEAFLLDVPLRFILFAQFVPDALADDSLPIVPPNPGFRTGPGLIQFIYEAPGPGFSFTGSIDSLQLVPEPATLLLLGFAIAILFRRPAMILRSPHQPSRSGH